MTKSSVDYSSRVAWGLARALSIAFPWFTLRWMPNPEFQRSIPILLSQYLVVAVLSAEIKHKYPESVPWILVTAVPFLTAVTVLLTWHF